ncbi:MAG: hypothetical protein IKK14_00350 [Oscillospiraceae bacterium]|nr:hypothetical protein [Oscillospiraceae bacterium]
MRYEEAIEKLNTANPEELSEKIEKLKNRENFPEEEINSLLCETVGMLFSASKEIKAPELYRVVRNGGKPLHNHEKTLFEESPLFGEEYIRFSYDPIVPFVEGKIAEGENVSLMTYRKAVAENPLALLIEGFPEDSNVFDILEKDGLEKSGKENYIKAAKFIKSELVKEEKDGELIRKIKALFESDEKCAALCYSHDGADYVAMKKDIVDTYYICTSVIFCRLDWMENKGEMVEVTPISHSVGAVVPGKEIEYDEFGEVGTFTFEMDDYR